nr:MAG TPA: hypothetical protein [Caudoviricetes sp.]
MTSFRQSNSNFILYSMFSFHNTSKCSSFTFS